MKVVIFMILALGFLSPTEGQSKPATNKRRSGTNTSAAHKLVAIKVTGNTSYDPAAVIAGTGLRLGQAVNEDAFQEAAKKLGETGLFRNVAYSFSYDSEGTKLELELEDNEKLVPVEFDNLVWYSRPELLDKIRQSIPLFRGKVPATGSMIDDIADLLSVMLAQKNPQLHLDYLRGGTGPEHAIVFSVSGTDIRMGKVEYPGASSAHLPALAAASKKVEGGDYQRATLTSFIKFDLEPIYRKDGYLKATFGEPQAQVVNDKPDETTVDVKLPVDEGAQYQLSAIGFTGNSVFPAEKLKTMIHSEVGKPINEVQLKSDLDAIRNLYGTRGHVKATLEPQAEFDDAQHSVGYQVTINEGHVYKMGELVLDGLDDKLTARVREDWALREGDTYDSSYPHRFVKQEVLGLPQDSRWSVAVHESIDDKDSTVDVNLAFSKNQ